MTAFYLLIAVLMAASFALSWWTVLTTRPPQLLDNVPETTEEHALGLLLASPAGAVAGPNGWDTDEVAATLREIRSL